MPTHEEHQQYGSAKPACQQIVDDLLSKLHASRITYRIATSTPGLCPVFVEALALPPTPDSPPLVSLLTAPAIDLRKAETFNLIANEKKILLHTDCLNSRVPSPPVLVEVYGAKSQMLLPTHVHGEIWSVLSVHEAKGVRRWHEEDGTVETLVEAGGKLVETLGTEGVVPGVTDVIIA